MPRPDPARRAPMRIRRAAAAVVGVLCALAVAAPAASAFVVCDYNAGTLNVRFQPESGTGGGSTQTGTISPGFDSIVIRDGAALRGCSGGTPTVANTDLINVVDEVTAGNQTIVVDNPAALAGELWKFNLGTGTDTIAFTRAKGISIGGTSGGIAVNFNSHEAGTVNESTGVLGVDLFTVVADSGTGNGGSFFADGSLNGPGAVPTIIPVRFDATPSNASLPNVLKGGAGADTLIGSTRADTIGGGAGDDTILQSTGNDIVNGDGGNDTLSFAAGASPVTADLATGSAATPAGGTDTLTGIERITGGTGNDTLAGDANANRLDGGPGDDTLEGRAGADELIGGTGTDTMTYAKAPAGVTLDVATGGTQGDAQGDTLTGIETVLGSPFPDAFTGTDAAETFDPGAGADRVDARGGNDLLLIRDEAADSVTCGDEFDTIVADAPGLDVIGADCEARAFAEGPPPDTTLTTAAPPSPAAVLPADKDGDGVTADEDCDDANAKRSPGLKEIVGNTVDENCDGKAVPFGRVASPISFAFRGGTTLRFTRLTVSALSAGAKVTLRCKGPSGSCPFKSVTRTYKTATKRADLLASFKKRKLKPGTVIEVEVFAPDRISKALRLTVRRKKTPTSSRLCRAPGATKLGRCG